MTRNDEVPQEVGGVLDALTSGGPLLSDELLATPADRAALEVAILKRITTLRAKLEAAEGEVARLREDARRWRFVRSHLAKLYLHDGTELFGPSEERLDAAIDAALGGNANA